ncbi:MAG: RsmE family RNA methyltransferase [Flavobacteriales bacterium]
MHTFHLPDLSGAEAELPEEEAAHAVRVLRLKDGEAITLVDGKGTTATGHLWIQGKHAASVVIAERVVHQLERSARIHLAVAPTKQIDRFEWMLEKCTEIGVDRITPLITARTERTHVRTDRLQKIVVSAMKQSQRAWMPRMDDPATLDQLLKLDLPAQRFFGWCEGKHQPLIRAYSKVLDVVLLIGPEGDFTPAEALSMSKSGVAPISLGNARLRTETAAIMACATLNLAQVA